VELTARDIARLLNVSPEMVYRWIKEKGLPARRLNEQYRCNRTQLLEWASARRIPLAPHLFRELKDSRHASGLNLTRTLEVGGIVYDLPGHDRRSVIEAIVERLPLPSEANRTLLLRMLLARERMGSTGIGEGIAIPHVRNPVILHVRAPMVTLGFLRHPVDFHAVDGKPVSVLFTLISPTIRLHLRLLSRLAFALQDSRVRRILQDHRSELEILAAFSRAESHVEETKISSDGKGSRA